MADVQSGVTLDQVASLIAQTAATSYVGGSNTAPLTLSGLFANYAASAANVGQYARVSDLYGSVDDILRCRFDGVNYRWVPQRPNFNGTSNITAGALSLSPLLTPPTLRLNGTLAGNVTITPIVANAYIGMQQRVVQNSVLGVFTTSITGLIGSNLTLLGGTSTVIEFGPSGWFGA